MHLAGGWPNVNRCRYSLNPESARSQEAHHGDELGGAIEDLSPREHRRVVVWAVVRTITALALVVAIYFLPALDRTNAGREVELGAGLLAFVAVIARHSARSSGLQPERPCRRGTRVFSVPVYILLFATAYFLIADANVRHSVDA